MTDGRLTLRAITEENQAECTRLTVRDDQLDLVASNADSLIHATKETTSRPHGIFVDEQMVGFTLFDDTIYHDGCYWILRLMIDEKHQGRGYGRLAVAEIVRTLQDKTDCRQVRVSHVPQNVAANALYTTCGFVDTGELEDDGSIILSYRPR